MRGIAIIGVILYHFFSRWIPPENKTLFYPYGDKYNFFRYGQYGVQLFFMISGFVIVKTLETTPSTKQFWIKRLIRLWPPLLISLILIFLFLTWFDQESLFPNGHKIQNLFSSITMINPNILNKLNKTSVDYLNGSYWSLWPEIQFYFLCSTVYFFDKSNFYRNYFILAFCSNLTFYILKTDFWAGYCINHGLPLKIVNLGTIINAYFNLPDFINYFSIGVFGYAVYINRNISGKSHYLKLSAFALFVLIQLLSTQVYESRKMVVIILTLFSLFIFNQKMIHILDNKLLVKIGVSSYFLYLIHEPIGVLMINKLGNYLQDYTFLTPLTVIGILIYFSILFHKRIEIRCINFLKIHLLKKKDV